MCAFQARNDTSVACKKLSLQMENDFLVAVQNPSSLDYDQLVQVELKSDSYKAMQFGAQGFAEVYSEILEQPHFFKTGGMAPPTFTMYINASIPAG